MPLEVFGFGSLCIMVEGRCQLSSFVTGASPNRHGVCSPARAVRWEEHADGSRSVRLDGVLIDRFAPAEPAGYPTVCKGRFEVGAEVFHALEAPTSLNALELLPRLHAAGISAIKIEGRQRGSGLCERGDPGLAGGDRPAAGPASRKARDAEWQRALEPHAEGRQTTLGAYQRRWQ